MNTRTKNPSTLSADFLFKPIGLAYHHALACISLLHSCGVYHHTVGVYTFIGLMRYSGYATDDMQNLRFDDIHGFALILYYSSFIKTRKKCLHSCAGTYIFTVIQFQALCSGQFPIAAIQTCEPRLYALFAVVAYKVLTDRYRRRW